jgi:hypothetical protein
VAERRDTRLQPAAGRFDSARVSHFQLGKDGSLTTVKTSVLAAHGETNRVKHTLRPLGVAMAGRDVVDPYKD